MFRTIFRNKLAVALALIMLCVSSSTVAFAAEYEDNTQPITAEESVVNITVVDRSGAVVGSQQIASAPLFGSTTLSLSSTAKKIQFIGNKNGGGANTSIMLTSPRLGLSGRGFSLNGTYQTIYTGSISGSIYIEWVLDAGGVYNLVFVATD